MTHLGRYPLGVEVPLAVRCTLDRAGDRPSSHPTADVRTAAGAAVASVRLPADEQGVLTGVFRGPLFLDQRFDVGRYFAVVRWLDSNGDTRQAVLAWDVIPSGSVNGAIIALASVERPNATYLLYQTDGGQLARGINPR